jgi:hypothetical protein
MAQQVFDDPNHEAAENYFIETEGEPTLPSHWHDEESGPASCRVR